MHIVKLKCVTVNCYVEIFRIEAHLKALKYSEIKNEWSSGITKTRLLSNLRPTTRECVHLVTCS